MSRHAPVEPSPFAAALAGAVMALLAAVGAATPAAASELEDLLRSAWVGRWVVLETGAFSDCRGAYTNNRMRGREPVSRGDHRFASGELARVDNLHLQRQRIDLLVELAEPLRVSFRDGPFELYEQLECRVELQIPVPRRMVRQRQREGLEGALDDLLERHERVEAARRSALYNGRRVEPLPAGYEETLAAYHAWKEAQLVLALRARLEEALDRAAAIAARAPSTLPYAQGLVLGVREASSDHRLSGTGCAELVGLELSPDRRAAPAELADDDAEEWEDGYREGQLLAFEIELARQIERCLP